MLFPWDVAVVVTTLFPDPGVFDDGDEADEILSTYFSLILVQEAKKLCMEAYAKNTNYSMDNTMQLDKTLHTNREYT